MECQSASCVEARGVSRHSCHKKLNTSPHAAHKSPKASLQTNHVAYCRHRPRPPSGSVALTLLRAGRHGAGKASKDLCSFEQNEAADEVQTDREADLKCAQKRPAQPTSNSIRLKKRPQFDIFFLDPKHPKTVSTIPRRGKHMQTPVIRTSGPEGRSLARTHRKARGRRWPL